MDNSKTLEVLEGDIWGEPEFKSHLVTTCYKLRKVPLKNLTAEDLRMLIGQGIGLAYIIPLALDTLENQLLVSGDMYEGDLLCSLSSVGGQFWDLNTDLKDRAFDLIHSIDSALDTLQRAKRGLENNILW
ncbi:MAG: contact-dependent growth inhibition system immunity protein [bacterium]